MIHTPVFFSSVPISAVGFVTAHTLELLTEENDNSHNTKKAHACNLLINKRRHAWTIMIY